MNYAKRMLMGVGVVVIAAMIVALIAPNTAHGLVAALVQVTNTAANPVPTVATDDPSTEPSSWESIASGTSGSYIHATAFTVPTTTEGGKIVKQLVWESVSVTCRNLDEPFRGVRVVWQGPSTLHRVLLALRDYFGFVEVCNEPANPNLCGSGRPVQLEFCSTLKLLGVLFSATGHYVTQ
jgi:hypothetical protein